MSLLSSLQLYIDLNGLVCSTINPVVDSTNNGLLYTAEAIIALNDNNELTPELIQQFNNVYQSCEIVPGLMKRLPDGAGGQEGPDDYYGCGAASVYLGPQLAQDILDYGSKPSTSSSLPTLWSKIVYYILRLVYWSGISQIYNNETPRQFNFDAWMGRFPHLTMHFKLAANVKLSIVERIYWSISLLISALTSSSNTGAWALSWLMVRVWEAKGNGLLEKLTVKFWRWRFSKAFGNPGNMLGIYFNNPNHPLAIGLQNSK